jgi:hypothetical protein
MLYHKSSLVYSTPYMESRRHVRRRLPLMAAERLLTNGDDRLAGGPVLRVALHAGFGAATPSNSMAVNMVHLLSADCECKWDILPVYPLGDRESRFRSRESRVESPESRVQSPESECPSRR